MFCKITAFRCYQCFSLRSLLFLANRAKMLIPNKKSYSGELLTAAGRCKKCAQNFDMWPCCRELGIFPFLAYKGFYAHLHRGHK